MRNIKDKNNLFKWLKFIVIICISIIVLELLYIGFSHYNKSKSVVYTDTLNKFSKVDDYYLVAGNSDFKNSKFNSYQSSYNKAKFAKYDSEFNVVFESAYTKGYSSFYNDVVKYDDGFIAVGGAQYSKEQVKDNATDGLVVLYDSKGNIKKSKSLQIAGDTRFTKVLVTSSGFIVIGQSILQNMVIGNNPKGGALIVKYDFDLNEVARVNFGGSKSAIFNDAIIDDDYIYLVGKDATRYGLIAKYTLDLDCIFTKSYNYTDTVGFSSIVKLDDYFYVAGSLTVNIDAKDEDKVTSSLIVCYDSDGNIKNEVTYSKNDASRFNKIIVDKNNLVVVGHTYVKDLKKSTDTYNYLDYQGIIVKYDKNLKEVASALENGSGVDYFSDVIAFSDGYLVGGASSSLELGSNNKDYRTYFLKYNKKLKREFYK